MFVKVADQFNSLAPALKDFHYFVCFYANNQTTLGNGWDIAVDTEVPKGILRMEKIRENGFLIPV